MKVHIDERDAKIRGVNNLVTKAFGAKFAANFVNFGEGIGLVKSETEIEILGKQNLLFNTYAGKFEDGDPTKLRIDPKYLQEAIEYARRYELVYKVPVSITIAKDILN